MKRYLLLIAASFVLLSESFANGFSELFIKTNTNIYTFSVGGVFLNSSAGTFQFYNLMPGTVPVQVFRNNMLVYTDYLRLYPGTRTVAGFDETSGIQVWDNFPLPSQIQRPCQNPSNVNNLFSGAQSIGSTPVCYTPVAMDQGSFNDFRNMIISQSFESTKAQLVKQYARNGRFNSFQVAELLRTFTFDSYKSETAKYCYDFVVDPQNYFKVFEVFTFQSYVSDLSDYMASHNR